MIINGFLLCIGAVIALVVIGAIWQSITGRSDRAYEAERQKYLAECAARRAAKRSK